MVTPIDGSDSVKISTIDSVTFSCFLVAFRSAFVNVFDKEKG